MTDAGFLRKKQVITRALALHRPDKNDALDVLSKVGGLDLAAMCGVFLGGALYRVPVLMDGFTGNRAPDTDSVALAHCGWGSIGFPIVCDLL